MTPKRRRKRTAPPPSPAPSSPPRRRARPVRFDEDDYIRLKAMCRTLNELTPQGVKYSLSGCVHLLLEHDTAVVESELQKISAHRARYLAEQTVRQEREREAQAMRRKKRKERAERESEGESAPS